MYHIIFIHLSVDGHLGGFHVLAIVNRAAMGIGVHASFRVVVFSEYMPDSGIAGTYDRFIPSFLRNLHILAGSVYIPTNSVGGLSFLYILSSIYCS